MWPQLLRCGNFRAEKNGRVKYVASMWPQLLRCGNMVGEKPTKQKMKMLQCGRNFCVAEIQTACCKV